MAGDAIRSEAIVETTSQLNGILAWLLDLDQIRLDRDAPLSLTWEPGLPMWLLVPLAVLAAYVIVAIHQRELGGRGRRLLLAAVRMAFLGLIVTMLCAPILQLQRNRTERSYVALLVDDTQSMLIRDGSGAGADAKSRVERVHDALLADEGAALRAMLKGNRLEMFTFGDGVNRQATAESDEDIALIADALKRQRCAATATNMPRAVEEILDRRASGRLAAVVLASDGRSTEPASLSDAISVAVARQVPVLPLLIGSSAPRKDVSVEGAFAAQTAFVKDLVSVRATVRAVGVDGGTELSLRLIDGETGVTVDSKRLTAADVGVATDVAFTFKPERVGRMKLRVEAESPAGESVTENNIAGVELDILDDQLRVLYVEGYPRYEYRYLKNMLLREPTIRSSCLLLSADAEFAQEGTDPIRRFPTEADELDLYDVVLFGDVDPTGDWLSPFQAEMLVAFVAERGGGFGLICGQRSAPHRFRGTPLEKLLPVRIDPSFLGTYTSVLQDSFAPVVTAEGSQSRVLRFLGGDEPESHLGGLYWIARTMGSKPGAEVLAVHPNIALSAPGASARLESTMMPLLVRGRYGAGRVLLCATDDTWRWRRGGAEWVFDTFWLQVCRSLVPPRDVGADHRLELRTDRKRYRYGEPVEIRATVSDWELLAGLGGQLEISVVGDAERPGGRVQLNRLGDASRIFEGTFIPQRAGGYRARLEHVTPLPGTREATVAFRVDEADLELRHPQADHDALRRLAAETGGTVIPLDQIAAYAAAIQDRSIQIPDDIAEPLWDSKLAMIASIMLLVAEWILRKSFGMI